MKFNRGFTLIELLVALAIFSMASAVIIDMTLDIIKAEQVSASNQIALDNSRFILQRIGKAIRVSTIQTQESVTSTIKLDHPRRGTVEYFLTAENRITERIAQDPNTDSYLDSQSVGIEEFIFDIKGADNGTDGKQPLVVLSMKLKPPKAKKIQPESIIIQTSLSQRCLDENVACQAMP